MPRYFYWDKKTTVEEATQLSIFKIKEFGMLCNCSGTLTWTRRNTGAKNSIGIYVNLGEKPYIRLNYTNTNGRTGEKTDLDYRIKLTTTPCHFGGVRYWFICPLVKNGQNCGRRTGTLYLASGGKYFGCRDCYNLTYESRNESRLGRPGGIGYCIVLDRKIEELTKNIKREYYAGKPTRKYKQVLKLEDRYGSMF